MLSIWRSRTPSPDLNDREKKILSAYAGKPKWSVAGSGISQGAGVLPGRNVAPGKIREHSHKTAARHRLVLNQTLRGIAKCCRFDLRYKEVIDLTTGQRPGQVRREIDWQARSPLIVPGQKAAVCSAAMIAGILPWESISRLGEDIHSRRGRGSSQSPAGKAAELSLTA